MSRDGDFELITLRNGSRAVRHLLNGEVMHPSVGPWREANLLYVEQPRLSEQLASPSPEPFRIYDVGLGAAANAAAALSCAATLGPAQVRKLELVSFEIDLAPLRLALADPEGFPFLGQWKEAATELMATGRCQGPGFEWRLKLGNLLGVLPQVPRPADLVFYDPFSPEKNPALWTRSALSAIHRACRADGEGSLLVTYSASTRTRVSLLLAGFYVGAGVAIGSKQETTVASTCLRALDKPLAAEWLGRWSRSSARAPHGEEFGVEVEQAVARHPQFESG